MNIERFSPEPEEADFAPEDFAGLLQLLDDARHRLHVDRARESAEGDLLVLVVELLDTECEYDVVVPRRNHGAGLVEGRRGAGTGVLDVHHRQSSQPHRAQDHLAANRLLAGNHARSGVADIGGLERARLQSGIGQRGLNRLGAERLEPPIHVLSECRHADTRDDCV